MTPEPAAKAASAASLDRLKEQVIDAGLCVACGACVKLCPHMIFRDGMVAAPDACGLEGGRCYDLCPQSASPGQPAKRQELFDARSQDATGPLGPFTAVYAARATDGAIREGAQYGGVVTTLLCLALEQGLIGEAVVTKAGLRGAPQGLRVKTAPEVLSAGKSVYAAGAALSALNQALAEDAGHKLGVVGLPCQSMAAASMKIHPKYPQAAQRLGLVIGLFCTLNMGARDLRGVLQQAGVTEPVQRGDFPPPPAGVFQVWTEAGLNEIPLDDVYKAVLPGCSLCPDLTAELADISVGAVEGRLGWNTVLVRTDAGRELMDQAKSKGVLEYEELTPDDMAGLSGAAANKRARGLAAWKERTDV